ncbi:TPA: DUF3592 domain-containing protein [Burkholderia aenigmatica]|uniref:DUF3592 domain-containing protein n=1 Tax=Burkholderia sp. AU45251 TaxID=3059204 RepID=UPI0026546095|nr:DUF3592 domain-containing protein [Burkholderia sp. AU45251]HDR9481844.1 DUF3592 domain-containing protein [Burkholderia aenigmatica]MDN7513530.1 DUF3592 domain-containing protein [Burkholderia sp. AU45251]HDR9513371.1 DUF3592 domain-containing protein [Burkholderia aenigmatica]HDR9590215.1 DUF3592 domain-containing protein [Burkholderia aenigmatica]HDR9601822.1 DUF3592 domain-containing protein [Burkholderia aenigmatica]
MTQTSGMQVFKGGFAVLTGTVLLVFAVFDFQSTRDFMRESIVVPGRVVRLTYGPHHPDIVFTTRAGERVEYPQGGEVDVHLGEAVEVRYLPAEPRMSARMNTFGALWGDALMIGGMGVVFFLLGVGQLRSSVRAWRSGRTPAAR